MDASYYLGEMPYWVDKLCSKVQGDTLCIDKPNQVIINEYIPGKGIAFHIDCVSCFWDAICSLGLASGCMIDMTNGHVKKSIYFEPRSLLIFKEDLDMNGNMVLPQEKWFQSQATKAYFTDVSSGHLVKSKFRMPLATPFSVL